MMPRLQLALVVLLSLMASMTSAKYASGKISSSSSYPSHSPRFQFLQSFCFGTLKEGRGTISVTLTPSTSTNITSMFLEFYIDETKFGNWYSDPKINCEQASTFKKAGKVVSLTVKPNTHTYSGNASSVVRPYFWFVAINDCQGTGDWEFDYEITFLQGEIEGIDRQFSFDEQGVFQVYVTYLVVFLIFVAVHAVGAYQLRSTRSYHPIVRLFTATLVLVLISYICYTIHYGIYAANGAGVPFLNGTGFFFELTSEVVFMFLLILLAKGWAITSQTLEGRWFVLTYLVIFASSYLALFIWAMVAVDPVTGDFIYNTPPGYVIMGVRCLAMLYFILCCVLTMRNENTDHKLKFYRIFTAVFTLYFVSLFVSVLLGFIAQWLRTKVVVATYTTLHTIFLGVLLVLLWPTFAHKYFEVSTPNVLTQANSAYHTL